MNNGQLAEHLRRCVTRGRVLTSPAQLAGYDTDGLGYKSFRPDAVVIPADADELVRVLRSAGKLDVPICMRGAGTSLSGGPVAAQGGLIVHTSALRGVRAIHPEGLWCEVECGVTLSQLDRALRPHGMFYPPDPSSGPVCTLGGNVAMNAGGAHCFRYGVTSNYVLGVEVVLPDGTVQRFGGPAGGRGPWREDWKRLMVGSEGTLGTFTRFWLRILPRPEKAWTFRATYPDLWSAERAVHGLVAHSAFPVAIELMDPRCVAMVENSPMAVGLPKDAFMVLTEIDGPADLVDARVEAVAEILRNAGSHDVVFGDEEAQREKLWKARKAAGGLMGQISPDFFVQDAVIPKRALAELLQFVYDEADAAGIPAVNVFHAGDGNLHPNFLFDSRRPGELEKVEQISKRLMQRVVELDGTLSGEHGIGNDKAEYMPLVFGADAMRLQLAVSRAFNPRHQWNPLKVFTQRVFHEGTGNPAECEADRDGPRPGGPGRGEARHGESPLHAIAARDARCFAPFLDAIDGVLCLAADATAERVRAEAEPHGLRFPLIVDPRASLRDQVESSGFAPASSRFGPLCDNIVGMNWSLPNGRLIRLGERVVKTTTGYDLFRFLLGSGNRLGQPTDYVLRLRADGGMTIVCEFFGSAETIGEAVSDLLRGCWIHWFDSVDYIRDEGDIEGRLRIVVNCPANEWSIFEKFLWRFGSSHDLELSIHGDVPAPTDGCPDMVLKTVPDHAVALARAIGAEGACGVVALCAVGVVHVFLRDAPPGRQLEERIEQLAGRHAAELAERGGDWHSRHLPRQAPSDVEIRWMQVLEQEFARP